MNSQYEPDPPHNWKRKDFDMAPVNSAGSLRRRSEIETNRDLVKPVEQLVCDVHEETHDPNRTALENIAGAQKRMTSMMARVALSNDVVARRTFWLNVIMVGLTLAILWLTYVMAKQMPQPPAVP